MKKSKKFFIDLAVLIIPVAIILLLMPVLPQKIPIHRSIAGTSTYLDKKYSFLLGVLPFAVYKLKYDRR